MNASGRLLPQPQNARPGSSNEWQCLRSNPKPSQPREQQQHLQTKLDSKFQTSPPVESRPPKDGVQHRHDGAAAMAVFGPGPAAAGGGSAGAPTSGCGCRGGSAAAATLVDRLGYGGQMRQGVWGVADQQHEQIGHVIIQASLMKGGWGAGVGGGGRRSPEEVVNTPGPASQRGTRCQGSRGNAQAACAAHGALPAAEVAHQAGGQAGRQLQAAVRSAHSPGARPAHGA